MAAFLLTVTILVLTLLSFALSASGKEPLLYAGVLSGICAVVLFGFLLKMIPAGEKKDGVEEEEKQDSV